MSKLKAHEVLLWDCRNKKTDILYFTVNLSQFKIPQLLMWFLGGGDTMHCKIDLMVKDFLLAKDFLIFVANGL